MLPQPGRRSAAAGLGLLGVDRVDRGRAEGDSDLDLHAAL